MGSDEKDNLREKVLKLLDDFVILAKDYPKLVHAFRYAIGAIYALHRSIELGHKNRKAYTDTEESDFLKDINAISEAIKNKGDLHGIWEAGFFCNASFARVDAINERFLKAIKEAINTESGLAERGEGKTTIDRLVEDIQRKGLDIEINTASFNKVRRVINKIKHEIFGQTVKDAEKFTEGDHVIIINSLEELVKLFKKEEVQQLLIEKYGKK